MYRFSTPAANSGNRIIAAFIDYFIALILINLAYMILPSFIGGGILRAIITMAFGAAYILLRDGLPFLDGQSGGKKLMGIRAVTENGSHLTNNWRTSALRNVLLLVSPMIVIELIVMLTNRDQQRLGDQLAKTRVIAVR